MSAALVEPIVQSPKTLSLVPSPIQAERSEAAVDPHPLLTVFIAGCIAMTGAVLFLGTILMWLALRHTGIEASW
jgi:hypothetical protein